MWHDKLKIKNYNFGLIKKVIIVHDVIVGLKIIKSIENNLKL